MASDLRVQAGMKLNLVTGGATLGEQTTYQGNTQYLDSDLTLIGQSLTDIDEDISYNFNDGTGYKTYRLKKSFVFLANRPANTLITALNLATYFDLRSTSTGGGGTGTETDPMYLSEKGQPSGTATLDALGKLNSGQIPTTLQPKIIGTLTNTNLVITSGDSVEGALGKAQGQIDAINAKSTITTSGTLPTGGTTSALALVVTASSMPLSVKDGDYYKVNVKSWYDLTAIGYGVVNAGIGAKIIFNATQNEYIYSPAGQNQIASEVPATAIAGSTSTIALSTTNVAGQLAELASGVKNNITEIYFTPADVVIVGGGSAIITHALNLTNKFQFGYSVYDVINDRMIAKDALSPTVNSFSMTSASGGTFRVTVWKVK